MKKYNSDIVQTEKNTASLIHKLQNAPLSSIAFHQDTAFIKRYFAEQFPVYIAVHEISPVAKAPATYTEPHVHKDYDEVNIILSEKKLVYKILLGTDEHIISNNASVFIPKRMMHAANVLCGEGYFITIRL